MYIQVHKVDFSACTHQYRLPTLLYPSRLMLKLEKLLNPEVKKNVVKQVAIPATKEHRPIKFKHKKM
jgi:hypothetical protein